MLQLGALVLEDWDATTEEELEGVALTRRQVAGEAAMEELRALAEWCEKQSVSSGSYLSDFRLIILDDPC